MKHNRIITWILALTLLLTWFPMVGYAADDPAFSVAVSPETAAIGGQAQVTVSLEDYDTASIAGLQVDITGIDTEVLEVENTASAITDSEVLSNEVSYNTKHQRVRLLYLRQTGTLAAPCKDVITMTVRINPDLTEAGSITLPVTVKIVTADSEQYTLTSSCTIHYADIDTVAYNTSSGVSYATVGEALEAAGEGETVILTAECSERLVVVPAGAVLDLNGHVLTADNVVSFGAVIDTAETVGGIKIPFDTAKAFTKLQPDNGSYLPIYDTEAGMYRFFWYELRNAGAKTNGNAVKFGIQIVFRNAEGYNVLAKTANSGVKLFAKLRWTGMNFPWLEYEIDAASIKTYGEMKAAEPDRNYAITLNLSGLDNLSTNGFVSAAPMISTTAEVGSEIGEYVYTVG